MENPYKHLLANFEQRKEANFPKKIDNSRLPAGSNMFFYCKHCAVLTDVLPELYTCTPKQICFDCEKLQQLHLI